jgi:hypothetical protein
MPLEKRGVLPTSLASTKRLPLASFQEYAM